ncbi:hypothetical protein DPEC_G00261950 [Dallia pectoralis]|uniref:Uncharacterized protein n=1 Tax=Dallia pectoralis TaxID=75939 RepID=A0ACC2FRX2_DALPE|nr:hypothetical protein DPEC_G00261950 [Dallia pectoralis]
MDPVIQPSGPETHALSSARTAVNEENPGTQRLFEHASSLDHQVADQSSKIDPAHTSPPVNITHSNESIPPVAEADSTNGTCPASRAYGDSDGQVTSKEPPGQTEQEGGTSGQPQSTSVRPDASTFNPTDEPPPYSSPEPKMPYNINPPQPSYYPGAPVITCQPGPNQPGFFQAQFIPSVGGYPPYTIYMNGSPLGNEQQPLPKDYMIESMLVTIFCCLMTGLLALRYSYETRVALARGDIMEAEVASQKARRLVVFSLMFGVVVSVVWGIYVVISLCA